MDVDCDNFSEIRKFILKNRLIQKSKYIAFDLQFTGLRYDNNERDRPFYFPYEKYNKMKMVAKKYNIIQIGITFFLHEQQGIKAYPFNFYVFPRETTYSDPVISLQAGCVEFNTDQQMDWNRWIRKGITYMKIADYKHINQGIQKSKSVAELMEFMDADFKSMTNDAIDMVDELLKDKNKQKEQHLVPKYAMFAIKKVLEKYVEQRKLNISIELQKFDKKDAEKEFIRIFAIKISAEEKIFRQNQKQEQLFGFTLLFEQIWDSKKAFVGHNCFFDILFIYESFVDSLPEYQQFKTLITDKGITFYDTKLIAKQLIDPKEETFLEGTSLEVIYSIISKGKVAPLTILLAEGFERYDLDKPALHEAGFDSYLTGWIFYQFHKLSDHVDDLANKININLSFFTIDMNTPSDSVNSNSTVFCIEVAPSNKFIKIEDLRKMKQNEMKSFKDLLKKKDLLRYVSLNEGMKQLFLEVKNFKNRQIVIKGLVSIVEDGLIKNLFGLQQYINARIIRESLEKNKEQKSST